MKTFALLVVLAVAVAPMYALQCYSGTDKDIKAKDCPFMTMGCYTIRCPGNPPTIEKGCDAIACPSAIAKAKWCGGTSSCCDSDLCNGQHTLG
ncbi:hypothetical protein AAVH_19732 [Aphelenchoides avenae]|nr:hypothetical protein AAVH_19732 [Aphelenchus avenae]